MDRQAVDKTKMRAERLRMLEQLQAAAPSLHSEAYVPDGAVDEMSASRRLLLQEDEVTDGAAVHSQRQCYTCKARYAKLHHFYAQLCPACAELNYAKRNQTSDLEGRVVLITGARVKIGFYAAVKLVRRRAWICCLRYVTVPTLTATIASMTTSAVTSTPEHCHQPHARARRARTSMRTLLISTHVHSRQCVHHHTATAALHHNIVVFLLFAPPAEPLHPSVPDPHLLNSPTPLFSRSSAAARV